MTDTHGLQLRIERDNLLVTLFAAGEIDYGTVSALRSALVDLTHDDTPGVLVDLSGVTFIDSTALSVLVQAKQRLEAAGRSMAVVEAQPRVARVLELAGLTGYLVGG